MKIAALYDIHGNLPALEAVLADVRSEGVDEVIVGGDVIPGPMPSEALAMLFGLELPTRFIMGNGDRETLIARSGSGSSGVPPAFRGVLRWVASEVSDEQAAWISAWPATLRVDSPLGRILFCHATPRNDTEIFTSYTAADRLTAVFADAEADIVVCGHTHMQFDRMVGATRIVNAGSVGMPFGEPGAYWLLIDDAVHFRHTRYDLGAAADRIRTTRYPQASEFAVNNVILPPTAAKMLDLFAAVELK
jgi:putative phosphoesterase